MDTQRQGHFTFPVKAGEEFEVEIFHSVFKLHLKDELKFSRNKERML